MPVVLVKRPKRAHGHGLFSAPTVCIMHVQRKDAAVAYRHCEASDELERGNHLTLPEQEYDTSRPAT